MQDTLAKEYYEWLCAKCGSNHRQFTKLLSEMHNIRFFHIIPMDANREADGVALRYQFATEKITATADSRVNVVQEASELSSRITGPCSVLEMMVALSIRCEDIMDNTDIGDRTGEWFWRMVSNLGLSGMVDSNFDVAYVRHTISVFLNRNYEPDGSGGLFRVRNTRYDLRSVEIWTQMLWYIDEVNI